MWQGISTSYSTPTPDPAVVSARREAARRRFTQASKQQAASHRARQPPPAAPAAAPAEGEPNGLLASLGTIFSVTDSTLQQLTAPGPSEESVLQAMEELPLRRAMTTWRMTIEERRERARRFRQANAEGVHRWTIAHRIRPSFRAWHANLKFRAHVEYAGISLCQPLAATLDSTRLDSTRLDLDST